MIYRCPLLFLAMPAITKNSHLQVEIQLEEPEDNDAKSSKVRDEVLVEMRLYMFVRLGAPGIRQVHDHERPRIFCFIYRCSPQYPMFQSETRRKCDPRTTVGENGSGLFTKQIALRGDAVVMHLRAHTCVLSYSCWRCSEWS